MRHAREDIFAIANRCRDEDDDYEKDKKKRDDNPTRVVSLATLTMIKAAIYLYVIRLGGVALGSARIVNQMGC